MAYPTRTTSVNSAHARPLDVRERTDGPGRGQTPLRSAESLQQGEEEAAGSDVAVAGQTRRTSVPLALAMIVTFMQLGRPFDQFLSGYHIPAVIGGIAILVALFTPWLAVLKTASGKFLVLFLGVMLIASIFSIWRGGSFAYTQQFIELNLVLFCLLAATPATVGQVRWIAFVGLFGCAFNALVGMRFDQTGRLQLTDETFGNSDEVAMVGGFCIPLVVLLATRLGKVFGTIVGLAGLAGCLALIGLSGTRFALVSLTVTGLVFFFRASGGQRMLFAGAILLAVCAGAIFLPRSTIERLWTITYVISDANPAKSSEAVDSLRERQQLSLDAIRAFAEHPLLGIGPNEFVDWRFEQLHKRSQPPHNTYLQSAAEEGIFGIILYLGFLIAAMLAFQRCCRPGPGWEEGRVTAIALQLALIYFVISEFFINCQFAAHQYVLAGLAVALDRLRQEAKPESENMVDSEIVEGGNSDVFVRPAVNAQLDAAIAAGHAARQKAHEKTADASSVSRYRFNRSVAPSQEKKSRR